MPNANSLSTTSTTTFGGFNIYLGDANMNNCSDFASTSGNVNTGTANGVYMGSGDNFFNDSTSASCNAPGTIYCVEQ